MVLLLDSEQMNEARVLDAMVSIDIYLNETTRHADVVLPPASALEKSHFDIAFSNLSVRNVANYRRRCSIPNSPPRTTSSPASPSSRWGRR